MCCICQTHKYLREGTPFFGHYDRTLLLRIWQFLVLFQGDLWHDLHQDPLYPVLLVLNKEESSVCFLHNCTVSVCYDMQCHPNFFLLHQWFWEAIFWSDYVFWQQLPIDFFFSVPHVGPWLSIFLGLCEVSLGPLLCWCADLLQFNSHRLMGRIITVYLVHSFFFKTAFTSVQLFSQRPSL